MINLNTCVKEQKLRLYNGKIASYVRREESRSYPHEVRTEDGDCLSYTDEGIYHTSGCRSDLNVVAILPLGTTDSPKSDKHPSIAWWESCPWITDRKPTKEDGDHLGQVIQQVSSKFDEETRLDLCFISCAYVKKGQAWIHSLNWKPIKQTPKEKALALIAKHKDSSTVGVWVPTPDEWNVISEGLEAL